MAGAKLSVLQRGIAACGMAILAGCASISPNALENASPDRLYSDARDEISTGSWDKAIPLLERLEGRAAGTPLAQQAQIEKAYVHYRAGDAALAQATLDRFIRLHPASPALDYALYLKGLVNFNDQLGPFSWLTRQDLSERDQQAAKESYEAFRELSTRFPASRYTPDALARMAYIVNSLAQYEVHVARYYFSRGAYVAAIGRAQSAITDYQAVPAQEEALFILHQSYERLGMAQLATDTRRVLAQTYPSSEFLARGFRSRQDPWWKLW
jgi:outer membrane protein assembly factor BamD